MGERKDPTDPTGRQLVVGNGMVYGMVAVAIPQSMSIQLSGLFVHDV